MRWVQILGMQWNNRFLIDLKFDIKQKFSTGLSIRSISLHGYNSTKY